MNLFGYKAMTAEGVVVKGEVRAENKFAVAKILNNRGFSPIKITPIKPRLQDKIKAYFSFVKAEEKIMFTRQLSTLFSAGVPLFTSLQTLIEQTDNEAFAQILENIKSDIEAGESFSKALSKHPKVFSELYVSMVYTGEEGGILDETLDRLASLLEKEEKIKENIKAATRYPKIVSIVLIIAIVILMTAVVPKFMGLFKGMGEELPLPTRIMIIISSFMSKYWYSVLGGLIGIYFVFKKFVSLPVGKKIWDYIKFRIVVFGKLFRLIDLTRFARILAALIKSGIPILEAMRIVSTIVDNYYMKKSIMRIRDHIKDGIVIADSLKMEKDFFPPIMVQMVNIGENSGAIDLMLIKLADHYDVQIDSIISNLSSLIEPFLILTLGMVVLGVALAIFLPMWDMMTIMLRK